MLSVLMMDAKTLWNHDPFFGYVDRWMGEGNDPQVGGGGSTSASFITDLWLQYRSAY
jgi:hypothetical protein